jgi:hypothetical protein
MTSFLCRTSCISVSLLGYTHEKYGVLKSKGFSFQGGNQIKMVVGESMHKCTSKVAKYTVVIAGNRIRRQDVWPLRLAPYVTLLMATLH